MVPKVTVDNFNSKESDDKLSKSKSKNNDKAKEDFQ